MHAIGVAPLPIERRLVRYLTDNPAARQELLAATACRLTAYIPPGDGRLNEMTQRSSFDEAVAMLPMSPVETLDVERLTLLARQIKGDPRLQLRQRGLRTVPDSYGASIVFPPAEAALARTAAVCAVYTACRPAPCGLGAGGAAQRASLPRWERGPLEAGVRRCADPHGGHPRTGVRARTAQACEPGCVRDRGAPDRSTGALAAAHRPAGRLRRPPRQTSTEGRGVERRRRSNRGRALDDRPHTDINDRRTTMRDLTADERRSRRVVG
jgi:hypothetical protein